ncbi:DMT family transporter [Patescibacteria group bacterium]|nr:DMT family transporter [Patescibacteria group bacterium]
MNWLLASLVMFVSSIVYYLITKKAQVNKIESKLYLVVNFSIPALLYFLLCKLNHVNVFIDWKFLGEIFLIALFLNYVGSTFSYFAMIEAPNAGYSVVVQKSYAIFTSVAAIYLFRSTLTIKNYLAILTIIFFTALLTIDPKAKISFKNYKWVVYSLIAFFCFGFLRLGNKLVISAGVPTMAFLFWSMVFSAIICAVDLIVHKKSIKTKLTQENVLILIGIGVAVSAFYYFLQVADVTAPNIGYSNAINTASNAFYTVLVALIFKDHLSWKKFLAVLGVTAGLILLVV